MRDIWEFITDSGGLGVASEIAALCLLCVGVWEHLQDKAVASFTLLAFSVLLFWLGAYMAWQKKNSELRIEIAKRARPDLTASFMTLDDPPKRMLRLQNSSSAPAVNIRIDDIHYDSKVLRFHPPETVTSLAGGLIDSEILESIWSRNNVAALFSDEDAIVKILGGTTKSETLKMRILFSNLDNKEAQKTWELSFEFWYDYRERRIVCGLQSVENI